MVEFGRRNRVLLASGCLLLVSLLLFSVSVRSWPERDPVRRLLLDGLAPLQIAFTWVQQSVGGIWFGYIDLVNTRRINRQLGERIAVLEREVVRLAELGQANERLEDLLRFRSLLTGPVSAARVIGRDPLPWFRTLMLDRGERDGVRRGMAVLAPQGVVGQIAEVSSRAARVLLLTDRNSGIDAIIQRNRARGIVQGALEEGCYMNYLPPDENVLVGDRVLTSGLDGIFPKGVRIGEVTAVSPRHRGLLQAAIVRPSVPLGRLEEVLIVDPTVQVGEPPS